MSRVLSAAGRLLRALAALTALTALTVGLPIVLWGFGGPRLPDHVPSVDEVTAVLGARDTGEVFLGFLVLVGFAAWAVFAVSVALELAVLVQRRPIPGPGGLGFTRAIAAELLAAAVPHTSATTQAAAAVPLSHVLTSPPAVTAFATAGPGVPPARTAPSTPRAAGGEAAATQPAGVSGPTYQVQVGDSLWSIAAQQLRDPDRWVEIFRANAGRPQPDGGALTDPVLVRTGWILVLPADAAPPGGTYPVGPGDTLPETAEEQLDDDQWDELLDLDADQRQPNGDIPTDPDLIRPGWQLRLTDSGSATDTPPPVADPDPQPPPGELACDTEPGIGGQGSRAGNAPAQPDTAGSEQAQPERRDLAGSAPDPAPLIGGPADLDRAEPAAESGSADPSVSQAAATLALGISAPAAAGLLTLLDGRRFRTGRRRRPGHRMLHRTHVGPAETALRATEEPDTVERLDLALRTLAACLGQTGQTRPAVLAATVGTRQIALRLATPTEPVAPFVPGHTPVDWRLDPNAELLDPDQAAAGAAPYPALATLGRAPGGELVMVDLEAAGAITLTGGSEQVEAVLTALAVELAVSGWADHLDVTVIGFGVRLAEVLPDRLRYAADLDDALDDLARRAQQARAAPAGIADSAQDARGRGVADAGWIPSIILTAEPVTDTRQQRIRDLVELSPRAGLAAVIAAGDHAHRLAGPWQITVPDDPTSRVPLDVLGGTQVVLQRCDTDTYRAVLDELVNAGAGDHYRADGYDGVPDEPVGLPDCPAQAPVDEDEPERGMPRDIRSARHAAEPAPPYDPSEVDDEFDLEFEYELGLREHPEEDPPPGS